MARTAEIGRTGQAPIFVLKGRSTMANKTSVSRSLAAAQDAGLCVDLSYLESQLAGLDAVCLSTAEGLESVGLDNPKSWKEVQGWLVARGHTTIPNTRSDTLQRMGIAAKDEAAAMLVEHRSAVSRARAVADVVRKAEVISTDHPGTGIIRCQWTESGTGRIYTAQPNLQAAPDQVREAVRARDGGVFVIVDWHAAELFGLAVLAEEWALVKWIEEGGDAHQYTADILGLDRDAGKVVNLGLTYGMTEKGMAAATGLDVDVCTTHLAGWFAAHPKLKAYRDWIMLQARKTHEVQVRPDLLISIPDEKWEKNPEDAERSAVAYAGQGIIALKMRQAIAASKPRKCLRLPLHDGALYELQTAHSNERVKLLRHIIRAWSLFINGHALRVRVKEGSTWAETREEE